MFWETAVVITIMLRAVTVLIVAGVAVTETVAACVRGTPMPANEVASNETIIKRSTEAFFIKHLLVVAYSVTLQIVLQSQNKENRLHLYNANLVC